VSGAGSGKGPSRKASGKTGTSKAAGEGAAATSESDAVEAVAASLPPAQAALLAELRGLMRELDPAISEGIKWKVPSWRTHEWFATTHLRVPQGLGLILHFGAKPRPVPAEGLGIEDPQGLLKWLGRDRAVLHFVDTAAFAHQRADALALLRRWLRLL
jgi:hypothetical protein